MAKKSFNLKYDPETDILHVAFGRAKKAISVEQKPDIFTRIDPKSKEVVGLTVLGFKNSFLAKNQNITITPIATS